MPRVSRKYLEGYVYHVLNRGNGKQLIFHQEKEYQDFVSTMYITKKRCPLKIFGYCLMPNHFHFLLAPEEVGNMSKFMHYLMTKFNRRHQLRNNFEGHLWQGRYKGFAIQDDRYLLSVLKYIETNPVRAGLVSYAGEWLWSSFNDRTKSDRTNKIIDEVPVDIDDWSTFINEPIPEVDIEKIRLSVNNQLPYGDPNWQKEIIKKGTVP